MCGRINYSLAHQDNSIERAQVCARAYFHLFYLCISYKSEPAPAIGRARIVPVYDKNMHPSMESPIYTGSYLHHVYAVHQTREIFVKLLFHTETREREREREN